MPVPETSTRYWKATAILTLCVLIALLMFGCKTTEPTPFETGDEVVEPRGCLMSKVEGRDVDC